MTRALADPLDDELARWRADIDDDCVRIAYGHMRNVALSAMATSVVVTAVLRDALPDATLAIWLAAVWANSVARLVLSRVFHARPRRRDELPRWWRALAASMGVAGATYGALILVTPGEPTLLVVATLSIAVAGHIAGGAQTLVATPAILVISAVTSVTPLMIAMFTSSDGEIRLLGVLVVSYLLMVVVIGRMNYQALRASLALRYANLALAERAEAATRDKSRFLAAASHDLRQPLHALSLFTDALRAAPLDAPSAHLAGRIATSLDALHRLVDSLLDVSRLDAGAIVPAPRPFAATVLGRRVESLFAEPARQRGLRLRVPPTQLWLHADPELVAQILQNLVANAIRYTPRGGVLVAFRARGERVRVQVWDSGLGIPDDQRAAIFAEFHQLANPERDRSKGVGLGLAIVERLARLLATRVEVRSQLGRGSCFWFDLPAAAPGAADEPAPTSSPAAATPRLVLVVDDDALAREGLTAALEAWGYRVLAARDAIAGADLAGRHRDVDAVVVDFRLPEDGTGAEAIEAIEARLGRRPPAVIVTGETDPARLREARAAGHPVLLKPVPPGQLRDALSALLADP